MDEGARAHDAPGADEPVIDLGADAVGSSPDAPGPGSAGEADADGADQIAAKPRRVWLRRAGWTLLAVLLLVLSGLQIQAAKVRAQVDEAETAQRSAELDEQSARNRLASVGDRVRLAEADEAAAQAELDRARADMTAKGFEEPALPGIQVAKAKEVKDLRAGKKKVAADIAEQNRLQPAAAACLFDMLRALSRVDAGSTGGRASEACRTVAASPGPA